MEERTPHVNPASGGSGGPAAAPAKPKKARWEEQLLTGSRGPALGLLVLAVALTIYSPFFLTKDNLLNVLDQVTVLGIMALGMTAVILIGGIDLSVGSVLALAMMVLGWLSHDGGLPMSLAIVGALAAGARRGLRQRRDDHVRQAAGLHRHAGDDVGRARPGQHDHRRPADRRLPRLVQQPGLEPPVRLPLGHGRAC